MKFPAMRYDEWTGETQLVDPVPNALDTLLRRLCREFALANETRRAEMRAAVTPVDLWTLVTFAGRSAVFALRNRSLDNVRDGLNAIAMMDPRSEDPRDMPPRELGALDYAARTLGANPEELLRETAARAMPEMARLIERFASRRLRSLADSLYMVTEAPAGPGFVATSTEPYEPRRPLDRIALAIGAVLAAGGYSAVCVTMCEDLPRVWLAGVDDASLDRALKNVLGGAIVRGNLRPNAALGGDPNEHPINTSRIVMVFVIELADEQAAEALLQLARAMSPRRQDAALLGVRDGCVFSLLVARSYVIGVPPLETAQSVLRFEPGIAHALRSHPR
jgi:hypothetical protein